MVNLDLTIFFEKVNRGEDLRWVGSRWPLTHALIHADIRHVKVLGRMRSPVPEAFHTTLCFIESQ